MNTPINRRRIGTLMFKRSTTSMSNKTHARRCKPLEAGASGRPPDRRIT
jgi:hypothetical protein